MALLVLLVVLELERLMLPDFAESLGSEALEPDLVQEWEPDWELELAVLEPEPERAWVRVRVAEQVLELDQMSS